MRNRTIKKLSAALVVAVCFRANAKEGMPLSECPATPNCVSSAAREAARFVEPIAFDGPVSEAFDLLAKVVRGLPRVRIVAENREANYLHAECSSRIFGFIDDLEFGFDPGRSLIHVRSAARVGYWDFGVNRRRVESIRELLASRGLAHSKGLTAP